MMMLWPSASSGGRAAGADVAAAATRTVYDLNSIRSDEIAIGELAVKVSTIFSHAMPAALIWLRLTCRDDAGA